MGRVLGIARRAARRAPMELLERATIDAATGVDGDFRGRPGDRQVTLLSSDAWQAACGELGLDVPWTTRRANILIGGIGLPSRPGALVQIGNVRLEVTMETAPCSRMDEQVAGLRQALTPDWRGGVCCRVLEGGDIELGSPVRVGETE